MDSFSDQGTPVGIYLRTYNWRMYQRRKKLGLNQTDLGERCGLHQKLISAIEGLRAYPKPSQRFAIADALDVDESWLFPESLLQRVSETLGMPTSFRFEMDLELLPLSSADTAPLLLKAAEDDYREMESRVESEADGELLAGRVSDILRSLTHRERRVLELRFGLVDGQERTLEEVGRECGVTRERIRQIEAKALRKLRHPSRSRRLRPFTMIDNGKSIPVTGRCQECGGQLVRKLNDSKRNEVLACFACGKVVSGDAGEDRRLTVADAKAWIESLEHRMEAG